MSEDGHGPVLRVATYNLYLGADLSLLFEGGEALGEELRAERLREVRRQLTATDFTTRGRVIASLLARDRVDVVGLQEVCTWSADGRPLWDWTQVLLEALEAAGEPYQVVVRQETFTGAGELVVEGRRTRLEVTGANVVLRRLGAPVTVASTGAGLFGTALEVAALGAAFRVARGWCSADLRVEGTDVVLRFLDTHTEAYDPVSRDRQRDELLAVAGRDDSTPLVVAGDFNAVPDRVGMGAAFDDAWVAAGNPDDHTALTSGQAPDLHNPGNDLDVRIDYLWVRGAQVRRCWRIGADQADRDAAGMWPSDHAGVVAEIAVG